MYEKELQILGLSAGMGHCPVVIDGELTAMNTLANRNFLVKTFRIVASVIFFTPHKK